ncbi:hypothetical protein [Methylobacterium sp. sgz302541]
MTRSDSRLPRPSLLRAGIGLRLALATGLSGLVWLAVAWALRP